MIRFFRYSGSKIKYINEINTYIKNSKSKIYCEPFVGSGAILFNLTKEFDEYIINDIDRNIIRIYKTFKEIEYNDYLDELYFIEKEFGDIKKSKESYYNFRNWFNKEYWNSDSLKEGIYLHFLANTCINSFFRFGPNGMNQSYGNRFYKIDFNSFNNIKNILKKTKIYSKDYKEFMNKKDTLYFLDPPYFAKASSYIGFKEDNIKEFVSFLKNTKEYIYTDILCEHNKFLSGNLIREMRSTSPHSKKQKNGNLEYIFTNLENKTLI